MRKEKVKIKISKEKLKKELNLKEEKIEKTKDKKSFFEIFSIVLIAILIVGMIVELIIIISLNNKISELENVNFPGIETLEENVDINNFALTTGDDCHTAFTIGKDFQAIIRYANTTNQLLP